MEDEEDFGGGLIGVVLTAKVKIVVTPQESKLLDETMEAYRKACNFISDYVYEKHEVIGRKVHDALYHKLTATEKDGGQFLLRSQMAESAMKTVLGAYRSILKTQSKTGSKDKKTEDRKQEQMPEGKEQEQNEEGKNPEETPKWIKPYFAKRQYDLVWNRDYSFRKDGMLSINTLQGRLQVPFIKKGMEKYFDKERYRFGTARLVYKRGKYFLYAAVKTTVAACREVRRTVGIDRGLNFIIVTYGSDKKTTFWRGRLAKHKREKYKYLRKKLQQRNTRSAKRRLKAIGHRENRWMQDVNHCVAKALIAANPKNTLFVLEDLKGIRSATEKVCRKDRYVLVSWPFFDLEQKIRYKAALNECKVINVNPRYTSQRCPECGHIEKSNRDRKNHIFCCKGCGYRTNDDLIGAMNLYKLGQEYLAGNKKPSIKKVAGEGVASNSR